MQVINMCIVESWGGLKYRTRISGLKEISAGFAKGGNMFLLFGHLL